MKKCYKCQQIKPLNDFYKSKNSKDGFQSKCIICDKNYAKSFQRKERKRQYWKENRIKIYLNQLEYNKKNKDKVKKWRHNTYLNNKVKILEQDRLYKNKRRKTDLMFNLNCKIQSAISNSLKNNKNGNHWENIVGYNLEQLKNYLQLLFTENMNWNKFLNGEISIDHILPKELFEFKDYNDPLFKICWSLKNLKPEWKINNIRKSDYLPNGRRARDLTSQEKLDYLKLLGYKI